MSVEPTEDLGTASLILLHNRPPFLGVQLLGQHGRADEITKHDRELPALGSSV
jgi:hypothetical protein